MTDKPPGRLTFGRKIALAAAVLLACGGGAVALHYSARAAAVDLRVVREMPRASVIRDRDGRPLDYLYEENRVLIPGDRAPELLAHAVIASEDRRFYSHGGVDYMGIARAALRNAIPGGYLQGGSTITQQLARNSIGMHERTLHRKLLELFLAWRIEGAYTKDEILLHYLNRIYFGRGLYGAETASRAFFGKSSHGLTLPEAALLAGMISSPNMQSPWSNAEAARRARARALERMEQSGVIGAAEARAASEEPLALKALPAVIGETPLREIRRLVAGVVPWASVLSGGLEIQCSLDADLQKEAEDTLRDWPATGAGENGSVPRVAVVLDTRTGAVLAYAEKSDAAATGTPDFRRPAGGIADPWIAAAAMARLGLSPASKLEAAQHGAPEIRLAEKVMVAQGPLVSDLRQRLGHETLTSYAKLCAWPDPPHPAGGGEEPWLVAPAEVASAFVALANDGLWIRPGLLESIRSSSRGWIYQRQFEGNAVFPRDVAAQTIRILLNKHGWADLEKGVPLAEPAKFASHWALDGADGAWGAVATTGSVCVVWCGGVRDAQSLQGARTDLAAYAIARRLAAKCDALHPAQPYTMPAALQRVSVAGKGAVQWPMYLLPSQLGDLESAPPAQTPAPQQVVPQRKPGFWENLFGGKR